MGKELAKDLRMWLREPIHAHEQRAEPPTDGRQRELIETRTESGFRRIRGPAGSGKSTVLAGRAAKLANAGASVLVVYFNYSLRNYLADLVVRSGSARNRVVWLGFHEWCKRTMLQAGSASTYRAVFAELTQGNGQTEATLSSEIPEATLRSLLSGPLPERVDRYDAILVDEGQDFLPSWWTALRSVLVQGGEMLLVADRAQDIYERNNAWTEQAMSGAGFSGPWTELTVAYRMPDQLREFATRFVKMFGLDTIEATEEPPAQTEIEFCNLRWRQTSPDSLPQIMVDEFRRVASNDEIPVGMSDVTFVVDSKKLGRALAARLGKLGINATTTFADSWEKERAAKHAFFRGDARVKIATIHSFKGWESVALIIGISSGSPTVLYTALTRLVKSAAGSELTVVCANERFAAFGRLWPNPCGNP